MDGLLSQNVGGLLGGMSTEEANKLVNSYYQNSLRRPAEQAGLDYWSNLLTSGAATPAQIQSAIASSNEAKTAADMRTVPFGSQIIGGSVIPVANYSQIYAAPSMPPPASMPPSPASNPFMAALQYQSSLPFSIRGFNPADIPATYQQVATPQRLDWSKVTVPQWLQDAINKDKPAAAPTQAIDMGVRED